SAFTVSIHSILRNDWAVFQWVLLRDCCVSERLGDPGKPRLARLPPLACPPVTARRREGGRTEGPLASVQAHTPTPPPSRTRAPAPPASHTNRETRQRAPSRRRRAA